MEIETVVSQAAVDVSRLIAELKEIRDDSADGLAAVCLLLTGED